MLSLLLDKNFWIGIIVVVAVFLVGYVYITKPKAKTAILTLLVLATLGLTVYSGYQIYFYNNTKNQMFGTYNSETINNQVIVKDLDFDFKNIEMLATGNGNEYAVKITTNDAFSLTADSYIVLVNNMPCDYIEISSAGDYVLATYQYNFYNDNKDLILNDTLTLRFALSPNSTTFTLTTQGGADAVALWNSYFNKNNFIVTLKESTASEAPDISYGEGEVTFVVANYYAEGELYLTQVYRPGESVSFPTYDDMYFSGWATTEDGPVVPSHTITEDINFYAKLDKVYTNEQYLDMALAEMQNGVLDLSLYPISEISAKGEPGSKYGYFEYNTSIFEVKLPTTLKSIGYRAFFGCTNLHTVSFTNGLESIGDQAFSTTNLKAVTIPGSVKEFGINIFNNTALESVVIEEGVTTVGAGMFLSCSSLTSVKLPSTLQSVGEESFKRCTALKSIYLPASATTMPTADNYLDLAFYGCSSDLVIYCGATEQPTGFGENWNAYNSSLNTLTVKWGYTEQEYLNEINGGGNQERLGAGDDEEMGQN